MKLTWENLNRFQRSYVTKQTQVFIEVENNEALNEEQKDVLFLENYNKLVKADYTNYKFPTSLPTATIKPVTGPKARKTLAQSKAKAKKSK